MEQSGISVWRQVSEALAAEIAAGHLKANERLPRADELARRFAVNRHTVSKAIQHLEASGLIRMERGRGAYAVVNPVELRMGARNWFEQNLREGNRTPSRTLLSAQRMRPDAGAAAELQVDPDGQVLRLALLGEADDLPVNFSVTYLPVERLPGLETYLESVGYEPTETFSFTAMFRAAGVNDFRRKRLRIRSRPATHEEASRLKMSPQAQVLVTEVLQVDGNDRPVAWARTAYSAGRVTLVMDYDG